MSTILSDVQRNAISATEDCFGSSHDRIWFDRFSCLTNRRDMVNVDAKFDHETFPKMRPY
jgi:hypothetical protein